MGLFGKSLAIVAMVMAMVGNAKAADYIARDHLVIDLRFGLEWLRCSVGQVWNGEDCEGEIVQRARLRIPAHEFGLFAEWLFANIGRRDGDCQVNSEDQRNDGNNTHPLILIHIDKFSFEEKKRPICIDLIFAG